MPKLKGKEWAREMTAWARRATRDIRRLEDAVTQLQRQTGLIGKKPKAIAFAPPPK